jgi:hypothetical protein
MKAWIARGARRGAVVGVLPIAFLSSATAGGPGPLRVNAPRPIDAIAMDSPRLAYDVKGTHRHCNVLSVRNLVTGAVVRIRGNDTCDADNSRDGEGVREIAVAGTRLAWVINLGNYPESDNYLYSASMQRPKERKIASAISKRGQQLGCVVGAGRLLAVNRWTEDARQIMISARLQTIGSGLRTIASGMSTAYAESTDGTRIAVLRYDGSSVGLYSGAGKLLRTVTPASRLYAQCRAQAKQGVGLRGGYLAVLTGIVGAAKNTLVIYNSHSGKLLHTWPVAKGAGYLSVSSGLAAYAAFRRGGTWTSARRTVHLLNLSTGKDRVVANIGPGAPGVVGVQLGSIGLAYAVNHAGRGLVVFEPMARLR